MALVVKGVRLYAPNPNNANQYEDCIVMAVNPQLTHAMVDFQDDEDPEFIPCAELEPACPECGGQQMDGCCGD